MRITIGGDDSMGRQARIYAEYRLFAALSQVLDTGRLQKASLVLRRTKSRRHPGGVVCTVTVELDGGEVRRLRTAGDHPYAAINRAVERFRLNWRPERHDHRRRSLKEGPICDTQDHRLRARLVVVPEGCQLTRAVVNPRANVERASATIGTLVEQVRAEYAEMPGLSITLPQAQRLWRVDQATCEEVFRRLVAGGVVKMTAKGRFVRA